VLEGVLDDGELEAMLRDDKLSDDGQLERM
jgi:hypothetical protein